MLTCWEERGRHIIQIAIPLLDGLRNKIPWYENDLNHGRESIDVLRLVDLLWTNPTASLWNTTFKVVFIAGSSYTIYLMLNDYKPTHDPNLDTFKVQYLIGGSAVLAILFPYRYTPSEVRPRRPVQ